MRESAGWRAQQGILCAAWLDVSDPGMAGVAHDGRTRHVRSRQAAAGVATAVAARRAARATTDDRVRALDDGREGRMPRGDRRAHLDPRRRADAIERSGHDGFFGALDWRRIHQDAGAGERGSPVLRSSTPERRGGMVACAAPRDFPAAARQENHSFSSRFSARRTSGHPQGECEMSRIRQSPRTEFPFGARHGVVTASPLLEGRRQRCERPRNARLRVDWRALAGCAVPPGELWRVVLCLLASSGGLCCAAWRALAGDSWRRMRRKDALPCSAIENHTARAVLPCRWRAAHGRCRCPTPPGERSSQQRSPHRRHERAPFAQRPMQRSRRRPAAP
jgi:hypothetical protein